MAHVTKITAGKSSSSASGDKPKGKVTKVKATTTPKAKKVEEKAVKTTENKKAFALKVEKGEPTTKAKTSKADKKAVKALKKAERKANKKELPLVLRVITAPFRAIGRYIHESWLELRQVRWPNRKATWKLVLAVFIYTGLFMAFITLLDMLFTFIFNNLLGK